MPKQWNKQFSEKTLQTHLKNFAGDLSEMLDCVFKFLKETKETSEIQNLVKDAIWRNLSGDSGRFEKEALLPIAKMPKQWNQQFPGKTLQKHLKNFDGDVTELLDCVFKFMKETKETTGIQNLVEDAIRQYLSRDSGRSDKNVLLSIQPQSASSVLPQKVMPSASDYQNCNVSCKKKSERALLKGYTCADCDPYLKSQKLPEKELQEIIQSGSKHRSTIIPPKNSPKGM